MAAYRATIILEEDAMSAILFAFYLPFSADGSGREYYEEHSECRFASITPLPTEAASGGTPAIGNTRVPVIR